MQRGLDFVDERELGDSRDLLDPAPALTAVLGHLNQAVVRPDIYQSLLQWGFRDSGEVPVVGHCAVVPYCISAPCGSHYFQPKPVSLARQVGAYCGPGVATIVAAVELLESVVEPRM